MISPGTSSIEKLALFEPEKFEEETTLVELINQKRADKTIRPKERPKGENVVDLMEALRRSVGKEAEPATPVFAKTAQRELPSMPGNLAGRCRF